MAERVHVGARPEGPPAALYLLGRHVERGAHGVGGEARVVPGAVGDELGDAEVEDFHAGRAVVAPGDEEVLGLEIAVDDAGGVRLVERHGHLREVGDGLARAKLAVLGDERAQVGSAEQVHDEEGGARLLVDAGVGDLHQVVALDVAGDPGLEGEAPAEHRIAHHGGEHHLERAVGVGELVEDLVDGAHPAGLEGAHHAVSPVEHRIRREGGVAGVLQRGSPGKRRVRC